MQAANTINLGTLAGLRLSAGRSALAGSALLWLVLTAVAAGLLGRTLGVAVLLGLGGVVLHWLADLWHQGGHAWAARRAGHPMAGIQLWWVLSSALYPPDEPALPKAVHIRRALGGPVASLLLSVVLLLPLLLLHAGTAAWWLTLFFFLDNLLTFGLGAFLPLGFTDGSTLLRMARTKD